MIEERIQESGPQLDSSNQNGLITTFEEDEKKFAPNSVDIEAQPIVSNFEQRNLAAKASTPIYNKEEIAVSLVKNGGHLEERKFQQKNPKQDEDSDEEVSYIRTNSLNRNAESKNELDFRKPFQNFDDSVERVGNSVFYVQSCLDRGKPGKGKPRDKLTL